MHQRTSGDEFTATSSSSSRKGYNNKACVTVDLAHLGEYDTTLLDLILRQPALVMPAFEAAAVDALKSIIVRNIHEDEEEQQEEAQDADVPNNDVYEQGATQETQQGEQVGVSNTHSKPDEVTFRGSSIQILLKGNLAPTPLRSIQSSHLNTLVRCNGIVISASRVRSRATKIHLRCSRCQNVQMVHATSGPFGAIPLPQRCMGNPDECGPTPYAVVPDDCQFVDQQTLKLQEAPEVVPTGEMPRSVLLAVERGLVDRAPPGTRVSIVGIVSLFNSSIGRGNSSVKTVYLRVLGMQKDSGTGEYVTFTPREEEAFRLLARRSNVYDILSRSIAPSISGSYTHDIKKAITCQLFSGSRKRLPDGMRLRGDINVLLLGDPSMAKSQFLKYATRVAPVGVYTSGKGSSAAGLTASVVRDQRGEFYLEGGAMVLADGGIVAIDEFDKMRPADRVAIHEAMEQQTISVAKAGITTVLNSRSSVLAAANPVFGRYDELKSASENIDLMSTILSRFDLIFLVRDFRDEDLDKMICHHVMGVHINNSRDSLTANVGDFGLGFDSSSPDGGMFDEQARWVSVESNFTCFSAFYISLTSNIPLQTKYFECKCFSGGYC
jgi:Predicted ATPase involved in replication control, Cdc46/Mcm family